MKTRRALRPLLAFGKPSSLSMRALFGIFVSSLLVGGVGCASSDATGSAFRHGELVLPAYAGQIAIYASGNPPPDAIDLGVVEVHGTEDDATVDTLMPLFVQKVALLGGDVAVIDAIHARYERNPRLQLETYYATCPGGLPCAAKHTYATNDEVMTVLIIGRAMTRKRAPDAPNGARPNLLPAATSAPPSQAPSSIDIGAPESQPAKPEENSP